MPSSTIFSRLIASANFLSSAPAVYLRMSRLAQSVSSPDGHGLPAFGEDLGPGVIHLISGRCRQRSPAADGGSMAAADS
jgi:hypothetical protein